MWQPLVRDFTSLLQGAVQYTRYWEVLKVRSGYSTNIMLILEKKLKILIMFFYFGEILNAQIQSENLKINFIFNNNNIINIDIEKTTVYSC